jgi:predicted phosphohydrolase
LNDREVLNHPGKTSHEAAEAFVFNEYEKFKAEERKRLDKAEDDLDKAMKQLKTKKESQNMKLQYCSDLHLEFPENKNYLKRFPLKPEGEILLLAGDIVLLKLINNHNDFFNYCADNFEATYWIPGNHEYYHDDVGIKTTAPFIEKIRSNVFLLNNQSVMYKNTELLFATLWSHIPAQHEWSVQKSVNDFYQIKYNGKRLSATEFNDLHKTDLDFLKTAMARPTNQQRIVVTHHVPTLMHYPEQYRHSEINSAFATELFEFIETSHAAYWIYGHHHSNTPAFKIGDTTMLTNQFGYVQQNEHALFNPAAIIKL